MTTFSDTGLRYTTPLIIESQERVFRSDSLSLKVQAVSSGAQRWAMELSLESTAKGGPNRETAALAAHRSRFGQHTPFTTAMPQHLGTEVPTSTVTVHDRSVAGRSVFRVHSPGGFPASIGRFITFATSNKIHQIVAASALGSGTDRREITIFPALDTLTPAGTVVSYSPQVSVYYAQDGRFGLQYTGGVIQSATVSLIENV